MLHKQAGPKSAVHHATLLQNEGVDKSGARHRAATGWAAGLAMHNIQVLAAVRARTCHGLDKTCQ